jgi:hypothetical protein
VAQANALVRSRDENEGSAATKHAAELCESTPVTLGKLADVILVRATSRQRPLSAERRGGDQGGGAEVLTRKFDRVAIGDGRAGGAATAKALSGPQEDFGNGAKGRKQTAAI